MAILKCKMCGGDLTYQPGATVTACPFCGTAQTLPRQSDDMRTNLFARADELRRRNEFDKAISTYEKILDMDNTDAEAHWGAVLSRYGIEYVEDPDSHEHIPTCHRVQPSSILTDVDYTAALRYAPDNAVRAIYEREGRRIAEIQRGILAISETEKPYDVFICYKETDENGNRTVDSTLAQDIYYQLTNEGFKVFFSRISLEDKLGHEYEPYIFAALNSAKVMLVIGTKKEFFNAPWVRNEWNRFLDLMQEDRGKLLIPCYRDMDPYDLPEEMSSLQSQDMSRIGFVQDILHGVRKVVGKGTNSAAATLPAQQANSQTAEQHAASQAAAQAKVQANNLAKRAKVFMEDGDFDSAKEYLNKALDTDADCALAYLGKVQAKLGLRHETELCNSDELLEEEPDFKRALHYATPDQKEVWQRYADTVRAKLDDIKNKEAYEHAAALMRFSGSAAGYDDAARAFEALGSYSDAAEKARLCRDKSAELRAEDQRRVEKLMSKSTQEPAYEKKNESGKRSGMKTFIQTMLVFAVIAAAFYVVVALMRGGGSTDTGKTTLGTTEETTAAAKATTKPTAKTTATAKVTAKPTATPAPKYAVGDIVTFGHYEQDGNLVNGTEPIEWIVLTRKGNTALLQTKYGLDSIQYNTSNKDITWEDCSLRKWLNSRFLNAAFTPEEQSMIMLTDVDNGMSQGYSGNNTVGGNNTQDKVFLLSYKETITYYSDDRARMCALTEYAITQGAWPSERHSIDGRAVGVWWLRSPASQQNCAMCVRVSGDHIKRTVDYEGVCVRPVIVLTLP